MFEREKPKKPKTTKSFKVGDKVHIAPNTPENWERLPEYEGKPPRF